MPCCKAEQFYWCKDLETVYTDEVENKYCVFHAPEGKKGIMSEEFNERVLDRILEAKHSGKKCDLRGTVFPGPIYYSKYNKEDPLPSIDFSYTTFSKEAFFSKATFSGEAAFRDATFNGKVYFSTATFSKAATFSDAIFSEEAAFSSAYFSKGAYFHFAAFRKTADFSGATFSEAATFPKARFSEEAHFNGATLNGRVDFSNTTFSEKASFSKARFSEESYFRDATFNEAANFLNASFNGGVDFSLTKFIKKADFWGTTFNQAAFFSDTLFNKKADFMFALFSQTSHFVDINFNEETDFTSATFNGEADFSNATFKNKAYFRRLLINGTLLFEEVDLSHASFIETDLTQTQIEFVRCKWPKIHGREGLYDEIRIVGIKNEAEKQKGNKQDVATAFEQAEELYRQLKQKYKERHNEPEASKWHYGEKEMFRKKRWWRRFNPISFSNLYWASSGYGERPVRAGVLLLLIFGSATLLTGIFGLVPFAEISICGVTEVKGFAWIFDLKKIWLLIYNTIQYALFLKTRRVSESMTQKENLLHCMAKG